MNENLEGKVRKSLLIPLALAATLGYVGYSRGFFHDFPMLVWNRVFQKEGVFVYSKGKEYSLREVSFPENGGINLAGYTPQLMATAPTIPHDDGATLLACFPNPTTLEISRFTLDGQFDGTLKFVGSTDKEIKIGSLPPGDYLVKRTDDPKRYSAFSIR